MMEHIMPDIPRIYTAVAEWMACMLFILPVKKRFQKWQTAGIMAAVLLIQSVFLVMTDDIKIYFWIPCMIVAVFLMIVFIYSCCEITFTDAAYFGMIAFVVAEFMASFEWRGCMLLFRRGDDKLVALQRYSCSDLWCNRTDPV